MKHVIAWCKNAFVPIREIYNLKDDYSKGRVIQLASSLLTTFYNVFITGIFYTGFLSMYGMSITDTGIMTFIPYIANLFSIFSPRLLGRFRKRKGLLLAAKTIYYAIYILLTTLMPQFVTDPAGRRILFIVIVGVATGFYALFGSGFTIWFYNFYPANNEQRTRYLTYNQIFSSILSSVILLTSGAITDAMNGSAYQDQLILIFRYLAFGLVLIEVFIQSKAKEYPYQETENIKFREVFTLSFKHKKYMACCLFMFFWGYVANLNNGLWNYHLLNHMEFGYTMINTVSVAYTIILLLGSPIWRRWLRRYSWIKTFSFAMLLFAPTEFIFFCMDKSSTWIFFPNSMLQNFFAVGLNLAYANILYMNMPAENSTTHLTFNTIGCNVFSFLGLITGTWVSSLYDGPISFLGIDVYAVQFTTILRGIFLGAGGLYLFFRWRDFTRDEDIREVETLAVYHKREKETKRAIRKAKRQAKRG
ncbi:MAG: MFS transporter [Oscillospiraceae bacterium]|nr:MFS transporter [Oscillospiraceae bacterium]